MKEGKAYIGDEKNIKDYLHLYLGCEMFFDRRIWTVSKIGGNRVTLRREGEFNKYVEIYPPDGKLILRPLSDMTEDELQECGNLVYDFSDDDSGMDLNNHRPDDFLLTTSEQFHWLLKRHFDVFGLIESGLAIDKTTLNKQS